MAEKIIGFFKYLREEYDEDFKPFTRSLSSVLELGLKDTYGTGLDLLLIQYYFDGEVNECFEWLRPVSNYNKKDKSISARFVVRHKDFHDCTGEKRKIYLRNTVLTSIELVKQRLIKNKNVAIDFDLLFEDAKNILDNWLIEDMRTKLLHPN